ncbi:Ig-like domain-containing protein, partial [Enterococcus faecalis]
MKKINMLLIAFLSSVFFSLIPVNVDAATFTNKDAVLNVTLENGPKFTPANSMKIKIDFDFTGLGVDPGDMLEIAYPDSIEIWGNRDFTFHDESGTLLATGTAKDNKIVLTFTDAVKDKNDIKGFLELTFKPSANKMTLGKNILEFESKDGIIPIDIELIESIDDLSKKGSVRKMSNGENGIRWTMVVNRNNYNMNEVKLDDIIADSKIRYVPNSLQVHEGIWLDDVKSTYRRVKKMIPGIDYSYTETANGVSILLPPGNRMYVIDLFTSVDDPNLLNVIGSTFRNKASLKWNDKLGNSHSREVNSKLIIRDDNNSGIGGNNTSDSSTSSTDPLDSSTSSTNPLDSSTSSTNPLDSSTSSTNPLDSSTSSTNPLDSSTSST